MRKALDQIAELTDRGSKISNENNISSEVVKEKKQEKIEALSDFFARPSKQKKKLNIDYFSHPKRNVTDEKFVKGNFAVIGFCDYIIFSRESF